MKATTGVYIISGLALAGVAALFVMESRRRKAANASAVTRQQLAVMGTPLAQQKFRGFVFDMNLNERTKNALPEITALQHMINAYYNGSDSIDVTGFFDQPTRNAVKDITGKSATSLNEFNNVYLIPKRGEKVSVDLITSITLIGPNT